MPTHRVLILDSNTDFAAILRDGLEQTGKFVISLASTGRTAAEAIRGSEYHLAIIDADVPDMPAADLLGQLRVLDPYLRIVFVPPFGQELPDSLAKLDTQGVLHKPFFVSQLAEQIAFFLEQKVVTAPPTRVEHMQARLPEITPILAEFSRQVSAETVALICQNKLVTYLGRSPNGREDALIDLMLDDLKVASQLARFLGEPDGHFDLHSYVGKTLSLYALRFDRDLALLSILDNGVRPGVVHLQVKRAVEELSALLHDDDQQTD
jgi:DNA-binding response OmpR family regulator